MTGSNPLTQLSILYCMVHMYIFMFLFYEYRCSRKTFRIAAVIIFFVVSAACMWIFFTQGLAAMGQWGVLIGTVPTLIFFFVMSRQRNAQFIFIFCFSDTVCIWIQLATILIDYAMKGDWLVAFILRLVAFPLLEYVVWRWLRRPFLEISRVVRKGWMLFALLTGISYFILVVLSVYPTMILERPGDMPLATMILALIALVYGTIFHVLFEQLRILAAQERQRVLEAQAIVMSHRIEDMHRAEKIMRIERHDMRHQLQTVASLVQRGDSAAVLDYIGASQERLSFIAPKSYCSNPILDAVLVNAAAQSEQLGIAAEITIALPEELPVGALELSIVFANALENAIQAVRDLPDDRRRIICKSVAYPQFMVEISNPYVGDISFNQLGFPITDKPGHGTGTRSIVAFSEKYNALCLFRAENGWFKLQIAMQKP